MGWQSEDAPGHEGGLIGLVPAPGAGEPGGLRRVRDEGSGGWRELHSPRDDVELENVKMFQAGCTCGWRSPRFRAPAGTSWWPFSLELPELHEDLEDLAAELWSQHCRLPDALAARAETRVPRAVVSPTVAAGGDGGRLVLVDESGGLRHFLLGRPVHAGDGLELRLADGRWLPGRYENQRGKDFLRAMLYFDLQCLAAPPDWAGRVPALSAGMDAMVELQRAACLRWPSR
jgi:hypothetical protein